MLGVRSGKPLKGIVQEKLQDENWEVNLLNCVMHVVQQRKDGIFLGLCLNYRVIVTYLHVSISQCSSDKRYLVSHHATLLRRQRKTVKRSEKLALRQWKGLSLCSVSESTTLISVLLILHQNGPWNYNAIFKNCLQDTCKGVSWTLFP